MNEKKWNAADLMDYDIDGNSIEQRVGILRLSCFQLPIKRLNHSDWDGFQACTLHRITYRSSYYY